MTRWPRPLRLVTLLAACGLAHVTYAQSQLERLLAEAPPAASAPATGPASRPADDADLGPPQALVLQGQTAGRPDAIPGVIELSNGQALRGRIYTTRDAPFRIFVREPGQFVDVPPAAVARIEAIVEWERLDDDWRFAESGSDVKIKTGHRYPARKTLHRLTLLDGTTLTGDLKAPLWVRDDAGKVRQVILYQRAKGALGQSLADLVYVRQVTFDPPATASAPAP